MVAIAHSDPYQSLSRKVGYSVGLEHLLRNVNALTAVYVREKGISFAAWSKLVKGDWKRNDRATYEIANFFGELNLLRVTGREASALYGLDNLSILRRYFENDNAAYDRAVRIVLTQLILEADGDIFLGCLASNFESSKSSSALESMVRWKWDQITKVITNPAVQQKLWDVISIKSQPASRGPAQTKASVFGPRPGPSPFEGRKEPFGVAPVRDFSVADSYLKKVLPARKGWAKDLLLFKEDHDLTTDGHALLAGLERIGLRTTTGAYVFWPYSRDLLTLKLKAEAFNAPTLSDWNILIAIATSIGGVGVAPFKGDCTYDKLVEQLQKFHALYKSGNLGRGSIRHQLPLYMAKPIVVAAAVAQLTDVPPLPDVLTNEELSQHRRFSVANLRGTDGALFFPT